MPAGETETSAPSLEQILWRATDRFREKPALVDSEEFAQHIARAFEAELPEEAFAERFFAGADRLHQRAAFAGAVVRASKQPLHVYEFDLGRLEYVIVEDDDEVVVVSEFGQFKLENDDALGRALEAAVLKRPERPGGEPRAYFVRASGEVLGVEAGKVARTLERLKLRQVSMPAVAEPGKRLASFNPRRRELSEDREQRALQQRPALSARRPDRWVAGPAIGSATRWEQMLGGYAQPSGRQVTVDTGAVVAIVATPAQDFAGARALAGSEMLAAVRGGDAPVRALGSAGVAEAFVPAAPVAPDSPDRFWVQPENAFLPAAVSSPERTLVARPLQLGEITGDPWTDWTLTTGGAETQPPLRVAADRPQPAPQERWRPPRGQQLRSGDSPIVAFRAPDGTLVVNRSPAPIAVSPADAPVGLRASTELAPRVGAVPFVALRALHIALERTAAAGGYRLPVARLAAAPDVVATRRALVLRPRDDRGRTVRLAAPVTARDHASRLLISMPFPNRGQLHVGQDLAEALHAYLAAPVAPLVHPAPPIGFRASAPARAALPARAVGKAESALVFLDLPAARPLVAGAPSISGLPLLLQRAVGESGSWTAGPGAPLPLAIHEVAERSPFAAPAEARPARRPPGPGEEEIVIPLPLWARMARSPVSESDILFSSTVRPLDLAHAPGGRLAAKSSGPDALRLSPRAAGSVSETAPEGRDAVGAVPLDAAFAPLVAPGRIRAGEETDLPPLGSAGLDRAAPEVSLPLPPAAGAWKPLPVSRPRNPMSVRDATLAIAPPLAMGLPPVSWSGRAADAGEAPREQQRAEPAGPDVAPYAGGSIVSALTLQRRVPVSLRFRYVGAPLWWSTGNLSQVQEDLSPGVSPELSAGAGAAKVLPAISRSILLAGAGDERGIPSDLVPSPGVLAKADAPGAVSTATAPSTAAVAAGPAYIAMSKAGAAGPVPAANAARARAQAMEMSIVAAVPPAPPPLAAMSASTIGAGAPHAQGSGPAGQDAARAHYKGAEDAVSHSKIEGSVDAIAQRIYHRIRRRLQSDRERFGG